MLLDFFLYLIFGEFFFIIWKVLCVKTLNGSGKGLFVTAHKQKISYFARNLTLNDVACHMS